MNMSLEIVNSRIPICPDCNSQMKINLPQETIKCIHCGTLLHIVGLGKTDRDFIAEKRATWSK